MSAYGPLELNQERCVIHRDEKSFFSAQEAFAGSRNRADCSADIGSDIEEEAASRDPSAEVWNGVTTPSDAVDSIRLSTLVTECRKRHEAAADYSLPAMMRLSGRDPLPKLPVRKALIVI